MSWRPFTLLCVLLLSVPALEVGATATTVDGSSTREYLEDFQGYTVGSQPPAGTFYSMNYAGSGTTSIGDVAAGCAVGQCLKVADASAPYASQVLNLGTGVNLCTTTQSLAFDMQVPDLSTGAVWEYRVSGAAAVAGTLPANSAAIRFTGLIGTANQMNYVVRGNTGAENAGAAPISTTITAGAVLHALIYQANCSSGTASFVFAVTGQTNTQRLAASGDLITLQLNRLGIVNVNGISAATAYLDNYDWQGAPLPAMTITGISPSNGFAGTAVAISGTGFQSGATVKFDYQTAPPCDVPPCIFLNEVRVKAPPHTPGSAIVTVTNPNGNTASTSFFYNSPPPPADPNACKLSEADRAGARFLFDTYAGNAVGDVPDRCWYTFTTTATDALYVSADSWADSNHFTLPDGAPWTELQTTDKKALLIDPAASGYNAQVWKLKDVDSTCRNQGGRNQFVAMNSAAAYRISLFSSSDPTELQTPNSGSAYLDINPGTSSHTLKIVGLNGAVTTTNINVQINTNQWYFFEFYMQCNLNGLWDFSTNAAPLDFSAYSYIFDALGNNLVNSIVTGSIPQRPLTASIDSVGVHCADVCLEDALFVQNGLYVNHAFSTKNCGGVGVNQFIYGLDYSYTQDFGIIKQTGSSAAGCGGATVQVRTFDGNLNTLGTLKSSTNPELCPGVGGVIAYQSNVGVCFVDSTGPSTNNRCIYVRDRYLNVPPVGQHPSDSDFEEGDDTSGNPPNSLCENDQGAHSADLAALDSFGLDYSNHCALNQPCDTADNDGFGPGGARTHVGYAFSEDTTGLMGAYIQNFYENVDDTDYLGYVQVGPSGSTITQICAWKFGDMSQPDGNGVQITNQYMAGIVAGQGIKMYRLALESASGSTSTPRTIRFDPVPLSNPRLNSAKAFDCAADKMYIITSTEAIVMRVIGGGNGPIGQVLFAYTTTLNPPARISAINEDGYTWSVGTNGIYVYDVHDEANIHLIGGVPFASAAGTDTLSASSNIRLDRGFHGSNKIYYSLAQSVYEVNIDGLTHGGVFAQDPNPTQGGASGYQDTDGDGISDVFEPCVPPAITNPDADDPNRSGDGITDGDDASITCDGRTYDGTKLKACSDNPGSCNVPDPDDPGSNPGCTANCGAPLRSDGLDGDPYLPGIGPSAFADLAASSNTPVGGFAFIAASMIFLVMLLGCAVLGALTKRPEVVILAGVAGGAVGLGFDWRFHLLPLWLASIIFLLTVGAAVMAFRRN